MSRAESMSVRELKKALGDRGISTADCFEKSDLVAKYLKHADSEPVDSKPAGEEGKEEGAPRVRGRPGEWWQETVAGMTCHMASFGKGGAHDLCVILLHGYGAGAEQFTDLLGLICGAVGDASVLAVAPQAPDNEWWPLNLMEWGMAMQQGEASVARMIRDEPDGMAPTRSKVVAVVRKITEAFAVPLDRVVLGGFSQGSMCAVDVALALDEGNVGGVIALSSFPQTIEVWAKRCREKHKGLRVLQTHGTADPLLPMVSAGWLRDLLSSNGATVQFESHGGAHDLGPMDKALKHIAAFLTETMTVASARGAT